MGTWNYRLCSETAREHDGKPVIYYSLREAYYNDDGEIWAVTENATGLGFDRYPFEDTDPLDTVRVSLDRMRLALDKPIVDLDTIVFASQSDVDDEDAEVVDFEEDLDVDNE